MKSNTYKMFITDLDGTLLDDRKNISEENIIALKKLTDHQVFITVFTGRNYLSAKRFIDALGIDIPVVFQNGAFIMNPKSKEVLYQSMLPGPEARSITEIALTSGLEVVAYKGFLDLPDMMVERTDWLGFPYESYIRNNSHRIQIVDSLLETIPSFSELSQLAVIGPEGELRELEMRVRALYPETVSPILSDVQNGSGFLEFFGPQVSKGIALEKVLARFHIEPGHTVFIGDNYNDLELMEKVGFPVAVENSPEPIKKRCRLVVTGNNESGVADAVNRIFFNEEGQVAAGRK